MTAAVGVPTPCRLPGCFALCPPAVGRGRPRLYCTDEHRRAAGAMREQTIARLARLRNQVRRDEHLLAVLDGDEETAHA